MQQKLTLSARDYMMHHLLVKGSKRQYWREYSGEQGDCNVIFDKCLAGLLIKNWGFSKPHVCAMTVICSTVVENC